MPIKERNQRIGEKAAKGDFTLVEPLDYLLLQKLPNEGEMFAGLYPLGELVSSLIKKFPTEQQKALTSTFVSARLRVLNLQGLVVYQGGSSSRKHLWQRTKLGAELLEKWEATQNGSNRGNTSRSDA